MNQQETPEPPDGSGHDNFAVPVRGRHGPLGERPAARVLLISATVSAALLAAAAGVGALVASDAGSSATAFGQPAAVEQPAPAVSSAAPAVGLPAKTATAAPATAAPAKAPAKAAAKPETKAVVKAPAAARAPAKTVAARKVAPAPAPGPTTYRVVAGDTVSSIAARFNVSTAGMLAANGLAPSSVIFPGQTLKLSGPAVSAPAPAPVQVPAPAPAPAPAAAPAPARAPAPAVRTIYVAGAGGQAMVDACIGPIHFTPTDGYSLFITEHDFCGGWARFSGISVGEQVDIPGYGSYRVSARSQVPNPGTTNDVAAVFGGFPRAVLQTCIPGTTQMLVIALN
ncbi:LysM peptidoglycan-binding domain-containing protein [Arthrobacter sp. NPDC056727]|uniref:LysM peptidoglycan-binding domain-containing protein n=1 Tax=Arthrobacter sp. NPDC056727 TaxID=3345927 RepID=UPI003672B2A1